MTNKNNVKTIIWRKTDLLLIGLCLFSLIMVSAYTYNEAIAKTIV